MIVENKPNVELHHVEGPTFHQHHMVLTFDLITCVIIKNISIKLESQPSSHHPLIMIHGLLKYLT
jgi:hypothetical protein